LDVEPTHPKEGLSVPGDRLEVFFIAGDRFVDPSGLLKTERHLVKYVFPFGTQLQNFFVKNIRFRVFFLFEMRRCFLKIFFGKDACPVIPQASSEKNYKDQCRYDPKDIAR